MAVEPSGERIYDPLLGKERDAFPGEVVKPGNETNFQRAIADAAQGFRDLYTFAASEPGEYSEEELNGILKAALRASEKKREELLDGFNTNPAILIQQALTGPNGSRLPLWQGTLDNSRDGLDASVENIILRVESLRTADRAQRQPLRTTLEYVSTFVPESSQPSGSNILARIGSARNSEVIATEFFEVLRELGGLPTPEIRDLTQLYNSLPPIDRGTNLSPDSPFTLSTSNNRKRIQNLPARRPGLEGIYFDIELDRDLRGGNTISTPNQVFITGKPEAFARIVDKGGYIPTRPRPTGA